MRTRLLAAAAAALLIAGAPVLAGDARPMADNPVIEARMLSISEELRCLVCQNETLADSNADLAADLRNEVRELIVSGRSDEEIKRYLVARYGDFVLYKPPVKRTTWLLWFGPFVLLAAGVLIWRVVQRRSAHAPAAADAPVDREAARRLLD